MEEQPVPPPRLRRAPGGDGKEPEAGLGLGGEEGGEWVEVRGPPLYTPGRTGDDGKAYVLVETTPEELAAGRYSGVVEAGGKPYKDRTELAIALGFMKEGNIVRIRNVELKEAIGRVVKHIADHPEDVSDWEISKGLGLQHEVVYAVCQQLLKKGFLKEGNGKSPAPETRR